MPKHLGGWGLKDLRTFGRSLTCKTLHRGIFGTGPWSITIQQKYMKGRGLHFWYRRGAIGIHGGSAIWRSLKSVETYFLSKLRWRLHSGSQVLFGIDPISCRQCFSLHDNIIATIHHLGFFTWDKVISDWNGPSPTWKTAEQIGLSAPLFPVWSQVCSSLQVSGIMRSGPSDHLHWFSSSSTAPSVSKTYTQISSPH